jgi:hypothetical protein
MVSNTSNASAVGSSPSVSFWMIFLWREIIRLAWAMCELAKASWSIKIATFDRTVNLGDKYPFMQQGWTQAEILQASDLLEKKQPESDGQRAAS